MRSLWVACLVWLSPVFAAAQETVWLQVEAQPTLSEAEAAVERYAARLGGVTGFVTDTGWYAITLGPYAPDLAPIELRQFRRAGEIPRDSFVADGSRYGERFYPDTLPAAETPGRAIETTALPEPEPEAQADAAVPDRVAEAPAPDAQTPAEARRAERALTADERATVQNALDWAGVYAGPIDSDFGPGTRAAMRAWQSARGYDPTGVLTTAQRAELLGAWRAVLAELGVETVRDETAGIEIDLPMGVVAFEGHDPPFARFTATGDGPEQVLLISREGDATTLGGLYEIMQTLKVVPPEGPRNRRERSFTIEGRSDAIVSTTYAELAQGEIKGYTLVWPAGDEARRTRVLEAMRSSFTRIPGVLPAPPAPAAASGGDLLAGLELRRPDRVRSGFFVDGAGTILTTADLTQGCERLQLDDETELGTVAADAEAGLALLRPRARLAPMGHARFRPQTPPPASEIAAAGYPYEGRLPGPTLRFGTLTEDEGPGGAARRARLALPSSPSAAGGPVFDEAGAVWGVLMPPPPAQRLPEGVSLAADATALADFLTTNGVGAASAPGGEPLHPEDLARRAADMTVAVTCWN